MPHSYDNSRRMDYNNIYLEEKKKAEKLITKLSSDRISISSYLEQYSDAKAFLELEKNFWHKLAIIDIKNRQLLGNHFQNADFFLSQANPLIEKHEKLKDFLNEYFFIAVAIAKNSAFIKNSPEELSFLNYYKQSAEINWHLYAGLWPYLIEPLEKGLNNQFYRKVSDFMLCIIEGISDLEKSVLEPFIIIKV